MDYSGGGSGILDGSNGQTITTPVPEKEISPSYWPWINNGFHLNGAFSIEFSPFFVNGKITILIKINRLIWGANR